MNTILYEKKHANIFILYISVLSAARFPSQRILLIIPFHSFNLIKMRLFFCTNVHFSFGKFNPQLKSTTTTEKGKRRKKTYFLLIVEFMKSRSSKESDKLHFFFKFRDFGNELKEMFETGRNWNIYQAIFYNRSFNQSRGICGVFQRKKKLLYLSCYTQRNSGN